MWLQILEGHSDFINSLTFDPDTGDQLASVGDDRWCRLWDREGNQRSFPLGVPGMSVCWHKEEPMKVSLVETNYFLSVWNVDAKNIVISV